MCRLAKVKILRENLYKWVSSRTAWCIPVKAMPQNDQHTHDSSCTFKESRNFCDTGKELTFMSDVLRQPVLARSMPVVFQASKEDCLLYFWEMILSNFYF